MQMKVNMSFPNQHFKVLDLLTTEKVQLNENQCGGQKSCER